MFEIVVNKYNSCHPKSMIINNQEMKVVKPKEIKENKKVDISTMKNIFKIKHTLKNGYEETYVYDRHDTLQKYYKKNFAKIQAYQKAYRDQKRQSNLL